MFAFIKRKEKLFTKGGENMAKINLETLSPVERAAVEARRAYQKKWRAEHKDRVQEHNRRFWEKKAAEMAETATN